MNKLISAVSALALLWGTIPAEANFTITTGSGTTVVAIDATNSGGTTACTTASTECPATVLIDSGGALLSTTTHVLNVNANAGTNLNTSALATDTHLTALGTSLLGTDAHLTAFTSANHTDLAAINTTLGTPLQASGTVVSTQATAANLKSQVNVVSGGIASGAVASGAIASGALAAGAGADGWNVTEGTKADTAWVSGSGSIVSILKTIASAGASSSITGWAGSTIGTGTIQAYGATEGTIGTGLVPGFNVHVTNTNSNGSAVSASSSPVVIASDQAAVAIKAASGSIASGAVASGALVDVTNLTGSKAPGTAAADSALAGGIYTSAGVSLSNGQQAAVQFDSTGHVLVNCTGCSSSSSITSWGGGTLGAMANYGTSPGAVLVPGMNAYVTNGTADPCALQAKTPFAFSSSSGEFQLVAPSGSTQVYICSIVVTSTAADSISLVGGTGATCTTGTPAAIAGSTTAASGLPIAATAGWVQGNGSGTAYRTITAGHGVCILQSGTTLIAGGGTYVQL